MPEKYLAELNRSSKVQPGTLKEEYVQWQRGAVTTTPLPLMKSWVDTVLAHKKDWLVLVFHGVDGIGWEALPGELLQEYFEYIRQHENKLWVATFADVTRYMRERMNAKADTKIEGDSIVINLTHTLDRSMYDIPLTLRTFVSPDWKQVQVKQGDSLQTETVVSDDKGSYILYDLRPNAGPAIISNK
jgi:hypothetical protein